MLKDIQINDYHFYYKKDIENLGLPIFSEFNGYDPEIYFSKTRLADELKIKLTEEELNNPHAFARARKGYYPIWIAEKLAKRKDEK